MQLVRVETVCHGHQDWFLCTGWEEKETAGLSSFVVIFGLLVAVLNLNHTRFGLWYGGGGMVVPVFEGYALS